MSNMAANRDGDQRCHPPRVGRDRTDDTDSYPGALGREMHETSPART